MPEQENTEVPTAPRCTRQTVLLILLGLTIILAVISRWMTLHDGLEAAFALLLSLVQNPHNITLVVRRG